MEFCPKCGSILVEKRKNLGCVRCNYSKKGKIKIKTSEKIEKKKEITEVTKEGGQSLPIVEEQCKKCKNPQSYFWTVQTRAGDESETKFFRCTKCKHVWRDYR